MSYSFTRLLCLPLLKKLDFSKFIGYFHFESNEQFRMQRQHINLKICKSKFILDYPLF